MSLLQGNTYNLPIRIKDCAGNYITADDVQRVQFVLGDLEKFYGDNDEDGVTFDAVSGCFLVPLTEAETFAMTKTIKVQIRIVTSDGSVDGSLPKSENIYSSITTTRLTGEDNQDDDNQAGE